MAKKILKKTKKEEGLPNFLLKISGIPENVSLPPKTKKNAPHLGPIFFGCHEYQPIFHTLNLGHSHELHKTASSTENILRDAFLSKTPTEKLSKEKTKLPRAGKGEVLFSDPYLHKCPGQRKVFVPEPPFALRNFGETSSIIEGEASREIPLYYFWKTPEGLFEAEYELLLLSDIWEKKRVLMTSEERMAHTHFPKEFVTLRVIGPTIPAAITITKIPSKRKTSCQLGIGLKGKGKTKKEGKNVKTEKEETLIPDNIPSMEEEKMEEVKSETVEKKESKTSEDIDREKSQSENDIMEEGEKADSKEDVEMTDEENVEMEDEEDVIKAEENEAMEEVLPEE